MRPLLQKLAELEQEHDRARRAEVAAKGRDAYRDGVQKLDLHPPPPNAAEAAAQEGQHVYGRARLAQRYGQEERTGRLHQHLADEPFGEGAVYLAQALSRQRYAALGLGEGKAAQRGEAALAPAGRVCEYDAAGALVHRHAIRAALTREPGLHEVGLADRERPRELHAQARAALMDYSGFHSTSQQQKRSRQAPFKR